MNNPFEIIDLRLSNIETLLLEIKHQSKDNLQKQINDDLLTIQQAAELLNLSVATLYGYVNRSAIPVMKRSKRLYFSRTELLEWIKSGRKKTEQEICNE